MEVIEALDAERVREVARRVLAASGPPPTLHALQFRVPVTVMGALLGVRWEALVSLVEWTRAFVRAAASNPTAAEIAAGIDVAGHLTTVFDDVRLPGAGTIALSAAERVAAAVSCLFQAHDACAGLIGNSIVAASRGADGADPAGLVRRVACEDAPVQNTRRFAATDVVIGEARIRAGQTVIVVLAAANLDEPDVAWSFGHGRHRCPGEDVAFVIAEEAVACALRQGLVPDGAGTIEYHPSANARIPDFSNPQERRT